MKEYTNKENYMNERSSKVQSVLCAFETEKRKINSGTLKLRFSVLFYITFTIIRSLDN